MQTGRAVQLPRTNRGQAEFGKTLIRPYNLFCFRVLETDPLGPATSTRTIPSH